MPRIVDFAALVFDMDGLVLDTEPTYFAAWQSAIEMMGFTVEPHSVKTLSGHHYHQVEAQMVSWYGQGFNLHTFGELSGMLWRAHVNEHGIAIKPGVLTLLDYAEQQRMPICLATNSLAAFAIKCLESAGIKHRFPLIITGDEVEQAKPAPDIFLAAASRMRVDIHRCMVLEDSLTGIKAASAAGAYSVYVPSTLPANPIAAELCDCMVDNLANIFESAPTVTMIGL